MSIADDTGLIVGVDTHLDTHTAAICDARGRAGSQLQVAATTEGYIRLLEWARREAAGRPLMWAIEGTRHYGRAWPGTWPARASRSARSTPPGMWAGAAPEERSDRRGPRGPGTAGPPARRQMRADGDREALRLLMIDRDNAVQSGKTARTALASVLVTAPADLRDQLRHIPPERRARACAQLACLRRADRLTRIVHQTLIRLGQRAVTLTEVADDLEAQIAAIVEDLAPGLVAAEYGLGALTAAQILLSWSHARRIRTEAAFAMLSGTAPVPVSSGWGNSLIAS